MNLFSNNFELINFNYFLKFFTQLLPENELVMIRKYYHWIFLCLALGQTSIVVAQFDGYYDAEDYQGLDSLYIYFAPQSQALLRDKETLAILDKVADFLLNNPAFRLRLDGHTEVNEMGIESENELLGIKRADKVRHYLETKGVPKCKIHLESYGSSEPIFDTDSIPVLASERLKKTIPSDNTMSNYYKKHHMKTPKKIKKRIQAYESHQEETTQHSIRSVKTNRRVECHFYLNENQNITMNFLPSDTLEIADTVNRQLVFNHNTITPANMEIALQIAQNALQNNPNTSIVICRFDSVSPKLENRMTFLIDHFTANLTKKPIYFSLFPCDKWKIYVGLYNSVCRKEELE